MKRPRETTLATLDGPGEHERLIVQLAETPVGENVVQLCQQSWEEALGWFNQQSIRRTSDQVAELKNVLARPNGRRRGGGSLRSAFRAADRQFALPRIVRAESA